MAFIGRPHPLLIHFPIALVLAAAAAGGPASITADDRWRRVVVGSVLLRERWWPLTGILEDCWFGARTFCAHEGGTYGTDR